MRHRGILCSAWLASSLLAVPFAGAAASPADKQAFLERPKMYLSFEIIEMGSREFGTGTPKDAITDGAYRTNRSVKFEVPLEMAMPGSFPMSSMPMETTEMIEEGRFIGWMAAPPEEGAAEEALTTGKVDITKSSMFLPVAFSVDDVSQSRFRDDPSHGWGTHTATAKGKGIAYIPMSGMLVCDLKRMTCDINNVLLNYAEDKDLVTTLATTDMHDFEPTQETSAPGLHMPKLSPSLTKKLSGFPITLTDPFTVTFTGSPASAQGGEGDGTDVTLKVTLSSKPAAKTASAAR